MKTKPRTNQSLMAKAKAALADAATRAVADARVAGQPLVLWRSGRIVRVPASRVRLKGGA